MIRSAVVFPQPDRPMSETNSCSPMVRLMSERAWVVPRAVTNSLPTPTISSFTVGSGPVAPRPSVVGAPRQSLLVLC